MRSRSARRRCHASHTSHPCIRTCMRACELTQHICMCMLITGQAKLAAFKQTSYTYVYRHMYRHMSIHVPLTYVYTYVSTQSIHRSIHMSVHRANSTMQHLSRRCAMSGHSSSWCDAMCTRMCTQIMQMRTFRSTHARMRVCTRAGTHAHTCADRLAMAVMLYCFSVEEAEMPERHLVPYDPHR